MSSTKPADQRAPAIVYCSFCQCPQQEAVTIIVTPSGAAICDECVATCVDTLVRQGRERAKLPYNPRII